MESARQQDLTALPLCAQAIVACRLARRVALAMLDGADQTLILNACDAIESISRNGDGWCDNHPAMSNLSKARRTRENQVVFEAVRWAFDSVGAAQGAHDFPVDATVTASAQRCIQAIGDDPRIAALQVAIIVESDIDQLAFACQELGIKTYDNLSTDVFLRLTPCHALTLVTPPRNIEEEYR